MANTYLIGNFAAPTTAAPVKVTTGTAIKTMLQVLGAVPFAVVEWGISFDGFAAAAPGSVALLTTGSVGATVTAHVAAGIVPFNDPNAPANTAGTSGTPFNLGTTHSGYTATAEGSITVSRILDPQLIAPTGQYIKQFPLGERPRIAAICRGDKCVVLRSG
jgi:hypothetical protein